MLADLQGYNEPFIFYKEGDFFHLSFFVDRVELVDYGEGINERGSYVIMVEIDSETPKMVVMEVEEYIDYIKQIDGLKEKAIEVEKRWEEEEVIIYNCDDCGKKVEFGGGDDFFLEPPYYNVDYPKVVCGSCFSKNYLTSNEVKDLKICLHCHSQPDKEDKICKNCGCDDIVNESDLIY